MSADFVRLQALTNFQVQDPSGQAIGTVTDAVINLPKTRIDYLVMSGNNGRSILVPWSSLSSIDAQGQMFTFKDPASRLESAPTFDANELDFTDPEWSQATRDYWMTGVGGFQNGQNQSGTAQPTGQVQPSAEAAQSGTAQPTGQAQSGTTAQSGSEASNQPGAVAVLASTLLNAQVRDIAADSTFGQNSQSNDGSTGQDSAQVTGTPQATPSAADAQQSSTQVVEEDAPADSGEVLGTVAGAIVTRINGDIRYILVAPQGTLADQINEARANLNRDNSGVAQNDNQGIPQTGGTAQAGTPQVSSTAVDDTVQATAVPATGVPAQGTSIPETGGDQAAVGDELIPVPFDIMFPTFQDGDLILRASPFMLRSAPVLNSDFESLGFGWDVNVRNYWGSGGIEGGRFPFSTDNQLQAGTGPGVPVTGGPASTTDLWAGPAFIRLEALRNYAIHNVNGDSIGNVSDFVINLPKTRIDWIVMDQNGRSVLVPWASLAGMGENSFIFRYDVNRLETAPDFDGDGIDFTNPDWDTDTINYWITGRVSSQQGNQDSQGENQPQATQQPTVEGTSVPATGGDSQVDDTQNSSVAVLASQLIGAPLYDAARIDARGDAIGSGQSQTNQATSTVNQDTAQATPVVEATQVVGTPSANAAEGTSIPQTGDNNQTGTVDDNGGDVLGTVQGAIVNRLSGDIRYLLVAPDPSLGNTGTQQPVQGNGVQGTTIPQTGSDDQSSSAAQATGTPEAASTVQAEPTAQATSIPQTGGTQDNADQGNAQAGSLIAVPFNSVLSSAYDGELFLRASAFMLRNAPVLNGDDLPDTLGFGWDQGILNFWNTGNLNQPQNDDGDE